MPHWTLISETSTELPKLNEVVPCLVRKRVGTNLGAVIIYCMRTEDFLNPGKFEWVRIDSTETTVRPFAWLDFSDVKDSMDEQFIHNLSTLGVLPL